MICDDPDATTPQWSKARRIANGLMINKPIVLTTGEWLLPCSIWNYDQPHMKFLKEYEHWHHDIAEERHSNEYCTNNKGETFDLLGKADVLGRFINEHHIVEKLDCSLWLLARTIYGIGESTSFDRGRTWCDGKDTKLGGPCSRFF